MKATNHFRRWDAAIVAAKDARKMSFVASTFFGTQPDTQLFQWLTRLRAAVGAKYSLYFDEILAASATSEAAHRATRAKLPVDYLGKFQTFQRKCEALSVCLIFDATEEPDYRGPGARLEPMSLPPLTGAQLYPVALSVPPQQQQQQQQHLPSIIMLLNDFDGELSTFDKIVHFYDGQTNVSYFLHRVDPKMTLVAVFESMKAEADAQVTAFFREMAAHLRCNRLFVSLKPGSK